MTDYAIQGSSVTLPNFNPSGATDGPLAITRRGEQIVMPWFQEWIDKGRVYQDAPSTVATGLTVATTTYVATTPVWMLDVPQGTTVVPLSVSMHQVGTIAGGIIKVIMSADRVARYSSGGTAKTPVNLKIGGGNGVNGPRASVASVYTGATAGAVTSHIELDTAFINPDVGAGSGIASNVGTQVNAPQSVFEWPRNDKEPMPQLVGPASWLIHTFAATTNATWSFRICWIELDS